MNTRTRDPWTWAGIAVVGAAAAIMSFTALSDLAERCGIVARVALGPVELRVAWLLPLAVDVLAAVATRVWLQRRVGDEALTVARRAAWASIAATVAGNAAHGLVVWTAAPPPWWAGVVVSAVPAAALGAIVHLAVLVGRGPAPEVEDAPDDPSPEELSGASEEAGVPVGLDQSGMTRLYRLLDANDVLLYVGITNNLRTRLRSHRQEKPWWGEVNRVLVTAYWSRGQALAVEKHIIENDSPTYNLHPGALGDAMNRHADGAALADQRTINGLSADEHLVADLRDWMRQTGGSIARDRIATTYGIGSTRAARIRAQAEADVVETESDDLAPAEAVR